MAGKTVKKTSKDEEQGKPEEKEKTPKSSAAGEKKKAQKAKQEKNTQTKSGAPEDESDFAADEDLSLESPIDPLVQKLLDYAKNKQVV